MSEFSRFYNAAPLPAGEQLLEADEAERAALAERFGLVAISALTARITLEPDAEYVRAIGRLVAQVLQSCAVSGEDLPVQIDEPIALTFVRAFNLPSTDHEVELSAEELDQIEMDGTRFDLGEAVAQSLALAIDPYLIGPGADEARQRAGIASEGENGAFAALKGLFSSGKS